MYSVMFNHLEGNNDVRPVFIASINGRSMTCLLDSGAKLPMFYGNKMLFDSYFSGNATFKDRIDVKTAGREKEFFDLYHIRNFKFGLGDKCFTYYNMYMLYAEEERRYNILLSASMFKKHKLYLDMDEGIYTIFGYPMLDMKYIREKKIAICSLAT